ncbi:MAG: tetratricopeptide repeat protein [Bacteroidota bacterium]
MKNQIKIISFLVLFTLGSFYASSQSLHKEMAYRAYLTNNKSLWKDLVAESQKTFDANKTDKNRYNLVLAQHGLLGSTMSEQDEDLFDDYFKKTKDHIEELIDNGYQEGNSRALLSSIYGWEMGYSPWKGMFLGGKSSSNLEKATKADASSPLVWQIYGGSKLFTPKAFGGSVTDAIEAYEKSVSLYESNPALTKSNWRYLDALAWLGQAYEKNNQIDKARKTYEKALQVEPGFGWAKYVLLPNIASK